MKKLNKDCNNHVTGSAWSDKKSLLASQRHRDKSHDFEFCFSTLAVWEVITRNSSCP